MTGTKNGSPTAIAAALSTSSRSGMRDLLTGNIRADVEGDDDELRQSLKQFGWIKDLPALVDEKGTVLVGNRRMRIAKELGIEPVVVTLTFGTGDDADVERLKLALASNIGGKPMTKQDRQRFAMVLYGEHDWTMQRIGEALKVTAKTISKDLEEFVPAVKTPKRGRPKGAKSKAKESKRKSAPAAQHRRADVVADRDTGTEAQAAAREREMNRDERIAPAQADALAAEVQHLKKQLSSVERRNTELLQKIRSWQREAAVWRRRAKEAGWQGPDD